MSCRQPAGGSGRRVAAPERGDGSAVGDQHDLSRLALDAAAEGQPGVLVRTVSTIGLGARPPIEALLVLHDGRRAGSILDGRLDPSIDDAVLGLVSSGATATRIGLADVAQPGDCAGTAEVLLQRLDQLPVRYWAPADPPDVAVTLLDQPLGATIVVSADGTSLGTLGRTDLDQDAVRSATALLRAARATAQLHELGRGRRALLEVRRRTATLVLAGGGELATVTAALAATLGWTVRSSDDADVVCRFLGACGPGDALVVMSHDPDLDEPVLERAATTELGYVGVLGSRRVHRLRHGRLRRRGLGDDFIARLRGPAGLDVGAWTPHETAVSIVAEILAMRSGRSGRPLTEIGSPIHR